MRTTQESERKEIEEASLDLARARAAFDEAKGAPSRARAGSAGSPADANDAQWARVALAQRRQREAVDAHAAGERGRSRRATVRAIFSLKPRRAPPKPHNASMTTSALAASDETHRATLAFVADIAQHDEDEDLHPPRLDTPAADLDRALEGASTDDASEERAAGGTKEP